jgi:hypothetical protein
MLRFAFFGTAALCLAIAGCSQAHTGSDDAGVDSFVPEMDGMVAAPDAPIPPPPDAPPPPVDGGTEPCPTPGALEMITCGLCGTGTRFCTSARVWEYGACTDDPGAQCAPGSSSTEACGMCGTQTLLCGTDCRWVRAGGCGGETGMCVPGAAERDTTGCMGGSRRRVCQADCTWGPYDTCTTPPTDLDEDGDDYTIDCNDDDGTIRRGSTRPCGMFFCGTSRTVTTGTSTCAGPGWTDCVRPAGCDQSVCNAGAIERRPCATECLPGPSQQRTCMASLTWSPWSACSAARSMRPASCATIVETACGTCGEGASYSYCNAMCDTVTTACMGVGCTPGATTRTTVGCPAGEYRESTCTAACSPGTATMCMPYPPEVDVIILVDVTGSHTGLVMANAMALATELTSPLLTDADVRVGVATFADFPTSPYGSFGDIPYQALLAPTSDAAMVRMRLATLMGMSGGDGPESGVQALFELAGGTSHPESRPFSCAPGLEAGGCWRPGSQRVVVVLTDITQHNGPEPGAPSMLHEPYTGITPAPATWADARTRMNSSRVGLFAIVPSGLAWGMYDTEEQLRQMATEIGQDPGQAIVTYAPFTMDITPAIRTVAANLRTYVGL